MTRKHANADDADAHGAMRHDAGLSLAELLICIALVAILLGGLHAVLSVALTSGDMTRTRQGLFSEAQYALERIVRTVQESDAITVPAIAASGGVLRVSERFLDLHDNAGHAYTPAGDGLPDADNDADGLANEDSVSPDPVDWTEFWVDRSDTANWLLQVTSPRYDTADLADAATNELCGAVTDFLVRRLGTNLVEIHLELSRGAESVVLDTRAAARLIRP